MNPLIEQVGVNLIGRLMVLDDVFEREWRVRRSASHTLSQPPPVGLTLELRQVDAVGPIETEHLGLP